MMDANILFWKRKLATYFTIFISLILASMVFTGYFDIMIVWTGLLIVLFLFVLVRAIPRVLMENSFAILPALAFSGSYLYREFWGMSERISLSAVYIATFLVSLTMFVYFARSNAR